MKISRLDSSEQNFDAELKRLLAWDSATDDAVFATVNEILRAVKTKGDEALLEYSRRFDQLEAESVADLEMPAQRLQQAFESIAVAEREAGVGTRGWRGSSVGRGQTPIPDSAC